LDHLDRERRTLARDGERLEQFPNLSRLTSSDGSAHTIIYSSFDVLDADHIIRQEISHYRALDAQVEWKVYEHDSPADLLKILERHGFEVGDCESVLALDLQEKHDWLEQPPAHRVERVQTPDQVELYRRTAEQILGKDYQFTASELSRGISSGSTEHLGYLCFDGAVPMSIGRLYTHADSVFGGLYGGATLPSNRRAGFYRSLTAQRGRDARSTGASFLIVDALPTSCPILKRLGFVEISRTWPCVFKKTNIWRRCGAPR
jgi:hypothetical protein